MMGELGGGLRGVSTADLRVITPRDEPVSTFVPYPIVRFADIEPNLENADLVKSVVAKEALVVLYGPSGTSKTFVATEMALAVASGQPWRGHRTRRGRVVYIAAEGARGMRNRLMAAKQHLALGPADQVDLVLVPSVVRLVDGTTDVDRLIRTVREILGDDQIALVIIDTLSQSMAGADENGSKDMTAAIALAQRIRDELHAAVLLVHHSGKNEAMGARGHSSLRAATDTELEIKQMSDGTFRVRASKQKEGETGAEWFHRLEIVEIGEDEDGDPVTTCLVKPLGVREAAEVAASQHSSAGKPDPLVSSVVEACLDLDRTGKRHRIPKEALAESGYLGFVHEQGWDSSHPVWGFARRDVISLLVARFEGDDEARREGDALATRDATRDPEAEKRDRDKRSAHARRRITKAIDRKAVVAHGDWIWLREVERDA